MAITNARKEIRNKWREVYREMRTPERGERVPRHSAQCQGTLRRGVETQPAKPRLSWVGRHVALTLFLGITFAL